MSNIVPYQEMQSMAKAVTTSGMFGFKNENQALTLMLLATAEEIHPIKALQQYHIINGKPALKSHEVLSRFQLSGGSVSWTKSDDNEAIGVFKHPQGGEITIKWDIQKAKTAGIYESNPVWKKYPSNMLRSRCITDAIYALYPACLGGNMPESYAQDIIETKTTVAQTPPTPEVIEEAEFELVPEPSIGTLKLKLANRLKELSFSDGDIRDFAAKFELADNKALLEQLTKDDEALTSLVTKFEEEGK